MKGAGTTKSTVIVGHWRGSDIAEPGPLATDTRPLEQPIRFERKAAPVADILTRPSDSGGQPRRSLRDRWRSEVVRSPHITDSTRVLLMLLAEDMREDGYVSVPRQRLAQQLDRTERKVSQRLADAVEARLLDRVVRGQKGRTAVYRALLRVPGTSTLRDGQGDGSQHPEVSENRHPESGFRVSPGGPTSSKAHHENSPTHSRGGAGSTSELPSQKRKSEDQAETPEGRRLRLRACESWGLDVVA